MQDIQHLDFSQMFSPREAQAEDAQFMEHHQVTEEQVEFDVGFPGDDSLWDFVDDLSADPDGALAAMDVMASFASLDELTADVQGQTANQEDDAPVYSPSVFAPNYATRRKRKANDPVEAAVKVTAVPTTATEAAMLPAAKAKILRNNDNQAIDAPRPAHGSNRPQRCVPWRKPGTIENSRMRGAVYVYRFAPSVRSKEVQKAFGIAVKSLMRYVYDSCKPEFANYGLYFGAAGQGPAGKADRALRRQEGRVSARSIGYAVDPNGPAVPELARQFLLKRAGGGGGRK